MTHVIHPIFVTHLTHDPSTHSLLWICVICFITQIVPDFVFGSATQAPIWFWFQLTETYQNYLLLFCVERQQNIMSYDVPITKVVVAVRINLIKSSFCSVAKFVLEVCVYVCDILAQVK